MGFEMLTCYESSSFEERQWSETCSEIEQGRGPIGGFVLADCAAAYSTSPDRDNAHIDCKKLSS